MYFIQFIKIGLLCLCSFAYIINVGAESETKQKLIFLNWSEYMDPELEKKFEQQYNVELIEIYFESDDARDQLLLLNEAKGYDLIMLNDTNVEIYKQRGWIAPLDKTKIPNLKHIDQHWTNIVTGAEGHVVPYFWGTTGIAYRKDLVKEPITSWHHLFKPSPHLQGRISMFDDGRTLIGMALLSLGYSINTTEITQINEARKLLLEQKPHVKHYTVLEAGKNSELLTGNVIAGMVWNGDALATQDINSDIVYVVPEEGTGLWVDFLTVASKSQNKELAHAFINFLNEPDNAAQLAEFMYYPSPNTSAEKLLPAEFLENPLIYPDDELIQKSETLNPLPPRITSRYNTITAEIVR